MPTKFVRFAGTTDKGKKHTDELESVRVSQATRNDAKPVVGSNFAPARQEYERLRIRWAKLWLQLIDLNKAYGGRGRGRSKSPKWLGYKERQNAERRKVQSDIDEAADRMEALRLRIIDHRDRFDCRAVPKKKLLLSILNPGACARKGEAGNATGRIFANGSVRELAQVEHKIRAFMLRHRKRRYVGYEAGLSKLVSAKLEIEMSIAAARRRGQQ